MWDAEFADDAKYDAKKKEKAEKSTYSHALARNTEYSTWFTPYIAIDCNYRLWMNVYRTHFQIFYCTMYSYLCNVHPISLLNGLEFIVNKRLNQLHLIAFALKFIFEIKLPTTKEYLKKKRNKCCPWANNNDNGAFFVELKMKSF